MLAPLSAETSWKIKLFSFATEIASSVDTSLESIKSHLLPTSANIASFFFKSLICSSQPVVACLNESLSKIVIILVHLLAISYTKIIILASLMYIGMSDLNFS